MSCVQAQTKPRRRMHYPTGTRCRRFDPALEPLLLSYLDPAHSGSDGRLIFHDPRGPHYGQRNVSEHTVLSIRFRLAHMSIAHPQAGSASVAGFPALCSVASATLPPFWQPTPHAHGRPCTCTANRWPTSDTPPASSQFPTRRGSSLRSRTARAETKIFGASPPGVPRAAHGAACS